MTESHPIRHLRVNFSLKRKIESKRKRHIQKDAELLVNRHRNRQKAADSLCKVSSAVGLPTTVAVAEAECAHLK